jgi:hypothetical protein
MKEKYRLMALIMHVLLMVMEIKVRIRILGLDPPCATGLL